MDFESRYTQKLDWLFERHPSVQTAGFTGDSFKPGLENMMAFDEHLGHPWRKYKCIHVAGTNGKGSVCSMIAASLAESGYRVGLYTSPHILDFRERIKIIDPCARMISREAVYSFLEKYDSQIGDLSLFEISTAMAFKWFEEQKVDYAVVEVGLGGRLDSTNIIRPVISVITSIGLDHCAILGDTRAAIAGEKAGIFKAGVPALVGFRDDETETVFREISAAVGSELSFVESEAVQLPEGMDLTGPYQTKNLATAVRALEIIGEIPSLSAISRTAAITSFSGRWETVRTSPQVIADIGHNPAALKVNFARLAELNRPLVIVYGIMADKDLEGILPLMPSGASYILCQPSNARALEINELLRRCLQGRPDLEFSTSDSVRDAIGKAEALASRKKDPLIYIGGSTFVVSEAKAYYNEKN